MLMKAQDSLIKYLNELGLSVYEAKAYLALLERSSLNTADVSKISGVPRGRIYDVLDTLVKKGIASYKPGKLKKYSAINIDSLRENLIASGRREWDNKEENIQKITLTLKKKLVDIYPEENKVTGPLDYIEIIKNPNQIHRKFIELFSKAQTEVLGFTKPPFTYATSEQIVEQRKTQIAAFNRNVIPRAVVQMPTEELIMSYFNDELSSTEEFIEGRTRDLDTRFVDELPVKLFVFDQEVCFFALEDPIKTKTSLTMLVTKHEAMAKSFKLLFESVWEKARDYYVVDNKKYYLYESEDIKVKQDDKT